MADYAKIPSNATLDVKPFKAHVDDEKLQDFKTLLKLSPIATACFENTNAGRKFGMTREWLTKAKDHWLNAYDWRKTEDQINSFPNFKTSVKDDEGNMIEVQFLALFSEKEDAIPIGFFHGWPGSIIEFLDLLDILRKKYTPKDLPYHVIVPSLPGYGYSGGPPLDKDYGVDIMASAMHSLMVGLGFRSGYLAQGGDIGSFVCQYLSRHYGECKAMHINMLALPPPSNASNLQLSDLEKEALPRGEKFFDQGFAYALEHGTRTATIGLALCASPLALLSWIGEKFLEWTDEDPPLDKILDDVTLYWMTDTFHRCIYPYRGQNPKPESPKIASVSNFVDRSSRRLPYNSKPNGYSFFRYELFPTPKSWADTAMNVVSFNAHARGGHFAAMEKPNELLADVEEWIPKAWEQAGKKLPVR